MPDPTPPPGQGAFRRAVVPVTLGLGSLALIIWGAWALFETQREDVVVARAFLTHIAAENHAAAHALLAPALGNSLGRAGLAHRFGRIEPWDHIGFSSRNTGSTGDGRTTELLGTGEAISGCESTLRIQMINGLIHSFDVTPLCLQIGTDI